MINSTRCLWGAKGRQGWVILCLFHLNGITKVNEGWWKKWDLAFWSHQFLPGNCKFVLDPAASKERTMVRLCSIVLASKPASNLWGSPLTLQYAGGAGRIVKTNLECISRLSLFCTHDHTWETCFNSENYGREYFYNSIWTSASDCSWTLFCTPTTHQFNACGGNFETLKFFLIGRRNWKLAHAPQASDSVQSKPPRHGQGPVYRQLLAIPVHPSRTQSAFPAYEQEPVGNTRIFRSKRCLTATNEPHSNHCHHNLRNFKISYSSCMDSKWLESDQVGPQMITKAQMILW